MNNEFFKLLLFFLGSVDEVQEGLFTHNGKLYKIVEVDVSE